MSVAMKRSLSSTHTPSDYQPGLYAPSSRMRHHRRSVDRVWPPALEMKLAQLSMDEGRQPDCQLFFASSKSLPTSLSSRLGSAHIIPAPPPLDSEDHEHDDDRETDDGMDHRSRGEDRRRRRASCDFPLTPSSIHYPRTSISVQYCKQSIKSPASSPFLSPSSMTHSPRRFPGGLEGFTKIVDSDEEPEIDYRSTMDPSLSETMPDSNSDSDLDQEDSHPRQDAYTPPRRRYIHSPRAAAAVIPQGFTFTFAQPEARPQPRSQSQTRSRPHSHYSSTAASSTTSSPAVSRRNSGTTSPRTFILQGFLARHSNGHIMHRRPTKCSSECSSPTSSSNDNGSVSGEEVDKEEGGYEDEDEDDDDDDGHDDRFLLLAQSPNLSEFDFGEFVTERQVSARKYQADSPVFFNGFPLLQMTPMKR